MDKFARSVQVDSLRPGPKSCIESLRSNRLRRMSIDKSAGWRPWLSYGTGKTYWHNAATGETSWERPNGAEDLGISALPVLTPNTNTDPLKEVNFASFEERPASQKSSRGSENEFVPAQNPVLSRSCYRRDTFKRLLEIPAPAQRPPPLQLGSIVSSAAAPLKGSKTCRVSTPKQHVDQIHISGSKTDRKALKGYLNSMVEREAGKWQQKHDSIRVKDARATKDYFHRLDEVHTGVHEGFKQMLRAGAHCMDLVLSVNNSNQESLSAADFVRLAAKLGVRTEEFEVEDLFEIYGNGRDTMDLETFADVFINTHAMYDKTMAPALVDKVEGVEGTRKIVEMEAQDGERRNRRQALRLWCTDLGQSAYKAMEKQKKLEKRTFRNQMNERWKIQEEVRRQEKLKEFMERHADRFVGASDRGKLLRHYLEDLRLEEESGRFGMENQNMQLMVKGMIQEWQTMVSGQAPRAEMAYHEIDQATKRFDQRTILRIVSKKHKYLTTSWIRTQSAGLVSLGATSKIADPTASSIGLRMLGAEEHKLREGACKMFGMILDATSQRELLQQIHKKTSRHEHPDVRNAAKKAMQDIVWRSKTMSGK